MPVLTLLLVIGYLIHTALFGCFDFNVLRKENATAWIGYHPEVNEGEIAALRSLSKELRSKPDARSIEIHWFDSWLYGGFDEYLDSVGYDRKFHDLDSINFEDGPMEEWHSVPENLISSWLMKDSTANS